MAVSSVALILAASCAWAAPERSTGKIQVDSVLITLIEQVEVAAKESGVVASIPVREGQLITEGTLLAQIEDTDARIAQKRAKFEFDIATQQAQNDIKVRFAKKSLEVARSESKRATDSVEKYKKSVSATELDQLRLLADRAALEVEQMEQEQAIARLTAQLKESEFEFAQNAVERRRILAPLAGVVVQIKHRRGEFVEAGQTVVRLLRIDRLRAEGFVNARAIQGDLTGCRVTLMVDSPDKQRVEIPGTLVFVSPEINPVNGQIRVWAEVENRDMQLRPGQQASMLIDTAAR